jgi:hypothetical protein
MFSSLETQNQIIFAPKQAFLHRMVAILILYEAKTFTFELELT